jgi:succinyl-diaminopimelate desuccinylase
MPLEPELESIVSLTRALMEVPGTKSRPADRSRCLAIMRAHLAPVRDITAEEHECHGFGSLVFLPQGITKPDVLLVGHLDVIEHPRLDVYQSVVQEGRIYGPGSGDMKGQCAILAEMFRTLHNSRPGISLGLAFTTDEECGGEDGVRFLFESAGLRCGIAMVPDGGSIHDVTVEEKGILHVTLTAMGRESHAARPWLVSNPLLDLVEAIGALAQSFASFRLPDSADHWYPTCTPTILNTENRTFNCIPGQASASLDIRFTPPHTVESVLALVKDVVGERVTVEVHMSAETSHLAPDVDYLRVTEELTGEPARLVRASGGSDARFISQHGIPVILSRPLVGNLHGEDEWIDIASMGLFARICGEFILRRTGRREG